jgi:two-component system, chemotaxis family, sensor kinase CheA
MKIDRNAILQTFLAETEETLAQMEEALLLLEVRPQDEELLALIFRVAHTLKGNAAALELREVSAFAHTVEELLAVIRKHEVAADKHVIDLLLQAADTLKMLTPAAVAGDSELTPSQAELLLRLRDVAAQKRTSEETAVSPASEHESTANQPAKQPGTRTLRVNFDKLDRMLDLAGEIGIAQGRIRQLLEKLDVPSREPLLEAVRETDRLTMELQEQVMDLRMIPIGPTFHRYERLVRDLANAQGKKVRLAVEGEDAGVDSAIIDLIRDPLTHMIRNAIDHGIETPEVRAASGKDPQGTVKLKAFREAGTFVIQLSDDGAGLNRARILERARALDMPLDERLSSEELARLVFEPGFSTAKEVTETSGRGVGMDVVRRNVEALHGRVELHTEEGCGVTITLRLPLTLAIIEGFSVGVGKERFVLPLDAVVECMELSGNCLKGNDGQGVMTLRGEPLPFIRLRNVLRLQSTTQRQNVVVVRQAGTCAGIVVDALYGEHQAVIKPLGKLFQDIPAIAGSTVLGDGSIALVLDVPGLFRIGIGDQASSAKWRSNN